MGKIKKVIAGLLVTALLAGGIYQGLTYLKKSNEKLVLVAPVESMASDSYYMSNTTLEAYVTTNISQKITVDNDMIIDQVYVSKGDEVKKGDMLVSFDMTLVEMELNIEKLKRQKLDQDLAKAEKRLTSLQNGGPIEEESEESEDGAPGESSDFDSDSDLDEASAASANGIYMAVAAPGLLMASFTDDSLFTDDVTGGDTFTPEVTPEVTPEITPEATPEATPEITPEASPVPTEIPYVTPEADQVPEQDIFTDGSHTFTDGEAEFHQRLTYDTEPYEGSGTEEDPYVFLCSTAKGKVILEGGFLNRMAGYDIDGLRREEVTGSWYLLEFHEKDTIADLSDRKASCIGYFLVNGDELEKPVDRFSELELFLEDALTYGDDLEDDDLEDDLSADSGDDLSDSSESSTTREEAIRLQRTRIASLNLDIQESELRIAKLEKKVNRKVVYSKLDGIVSSVGDKNTASSSDSAFIRVKSKDGFYLQGVVGELMLDSVQEGTTLECTSYEVGSFLAEVTDVSDYPVSSDMGYTEGNPNISYYSFSATISDQSLRFQDQDYVTVNVNNNVSAEDTIVLNKAFVRTENGVSYVYKDNGRVLKKQIVKVGATVDGGYNVIIKGGLSMNDWIAFPYGDAVKEGAATKEGSYDEMYEE